MIKKLSFTAVLIFSLIFAGQAQSAFQQLAIGVEAGTYGPGVTLATSLSPNFKLKAGLNFMNYKYNGEFDLDPDGYLPSAPETSITMSGKLIDPELSFTNGKLIIDYYPMKNGIFSLSAGVYAGNNSISVNGKIDNYNPDAVFNFEDITVKPNTDGTFEGKLKLGNTIKPYFGLGLGRTIANKRVGFRFDLGLVYQGDYKFESKNVLSGTSLINNQANKISEETNVPAWLLKCWPMINFSLSYRIF
jgi:hypothetical protein